MYTCILKHTVFSCMFQYTNTHTHREQELPSANTRSQIKYKNVLNTGLLPTSMYTQHVHHSVPCVRLGRKDSRYCPEEVTVSEQAILQLTPLPIGFLVQPAPRHYSSCLLYPQPRVSESRGSQPGLCSASRTQCAHYLHTRVKDLSIHQALSRLEVNRQSLTNNRIHDQSS